MAIHEIMQRFIDLLLEWLHLTEIELNEYLSSNKTSFWSRVLSYTAVLWHLTDVIADIDQQDIANAKLSAQKQCVYKGPWRRNLRQINAKGKAHNVEKYI